MLSDNNTAPRNEDIRGILCCSAAELTALKRAFKQQMTTKNINGQPFLGQLFSAVDREGTIREELWRNVATSDETFEEMLSGERWGDRKPYDWHRRLREAKEKIARDYNATARRSSTCSRTVCSAAKYDDSSLRAAARRILATRHTPPERPLPVCGDDKTSPLFMPASDPFVDPPAPSEAHEVLRRQKIMARKSRGFKKPVFRPCRSPCRQAARTPFQIPPPPQSADVTYNTSSSAKATPVPKPQPLAARVQEAVGSAVEKLEEKITRFEDTAIFSSELDQRDIVLEARVMGRVAEVLAERDLEIAELRARLDAPA